MRSTPGPNIAPPDSACRTRSGQYRTEQVNVWSTAEIRWFHRAMIPPEVREWVGALRGLPAHQPLRIDYYLRLARTDSLGVKLREGRLEIKQRVRRHGIVHLHDRVDGMVQIWRKWSFPLALATEELQSFAVPAASWIAVHKERHVHRYGFAGDGGILSIPLDLLSAQGCDLEVTDLRVEGQTWWSLALEAFGPEETLSETVMTVGQQLFLTGLPPILQDRASWSYPEWLAIAAPETKR
jgi:hypothetical protein